MGPGLKRYTHVNWAKVLLRYKPSHGAEWRLILLRHFNRRRHPENRIVVLQSVRLDAIEPSYMNHVAAALEVDDTIEFRSFSYARALFGRWDIFHVHWPEGLVRTPRRSGRYVMSVKFVLLLLRIRASKRPVVRTLHNIQPHELRSTKEVRLISLLDRVVSVYVRLNPFTPLPLDKPAVTIPHPHYRNLTKPDDCTMGSDSARRQIFSLLIFGFVKTYKGTEHLLSAFSGLPDSDLRLHVAGRASPELEDSIQAAMLKDHRISAYLGYISNTDLNRVLSTTDLVVIPYPSIHNSGVMLHALSADRPVLVAANRVTEWIGAEAGPGWVITFQPPLREAALRAAIDSVRNHRPSGRPSLDKRTWSDSAEAYKSLYMTQASRASGK